MHLLLIEDDLDLGRSLQAAFRQQGLSCEWLRRAQDAPPRLADVAADCVLLDLGLPDASGFDLLARWRRADATTPVIVITARTALENRLAGLDGGADDFVLKPFAIPELVSRIHAVVRRSARQAHEAWTLGELVIEPRGHTARLAGQPLALTGREFQLLVELAREPGAVVAKGRIAQRLAPLDEPVDAATLEMHVSNLRKKIGPERIRTVRGIGYQLLP
ncbi:response regulator [Pelomonas aquatica]|jgi:two-component system response regulator QseB|uniref:Response regulator transcription factor n=1 Tax=Pelomonas aquatica TaxID=431058 RepID=A0A9X4LFT8_9BURK|nr:response regulator transcription factor [Pelomonas aquatica]MCY4755595.1 response regulator transcription factor [Pelomonas aquatica]MDG0862191.1 response regulator transcription factor [Pelomonas aquatica]